ncbi:hypothetical protein Tco_0118369 [Tanacetum coccineum]
MVTILQLSGVEAEFANADVMNVDSFGHEVLRGVVSEALNEHVVNEKETYADVETLVVEVDGEEQVQVSCGEQVEVD